MLENKVYTKIDFAIDAVEDRKEPRKVLLCTPDYFSVVDVKNVYMMDNLGDVDKALAERQWEKLKSIYEDLKMRGILEEVLVIPGAVGLEDMVFAANQSLPWMLNKEKVVVMSHMSHPQRQKEVPFFKKFYEKLSYKIIEPEGPDFFEGMGDTIGHYGKNLLYGGYGHRSNFQVYDKLAKQLKVPVVTLDLIDARFYHLDTCFRPLDKDTVCITRQAFTEDDIKKIEKLFKNVIDIPIEEAEALFALNAHCINDQKSGEKVAILQEGTKLMKANLEANGYEVIEIDLSEFMKSGGNVFCMKMMLY